METLSVLELPDEAAAIRDEARELAGRFAKRHREVRLHSYERGEMHPELWREFADRGYAGFLVPEEDGGRPGGMLGYAVVMEELAAANLVLWMPVLTAAIGHAIAQSGPAEAAERWLPRIASGETLLALAVTEPETGHNLFRSATTVRRDGDDVVVDGLKGVTSGIEMADRALVLGRVPGAGDERAGAFTAVLVDPDAPGVTREELPMGGREGVRQWRLRFDGARAPASDVVGGEGQGILALWPMINVERTIVAALASGGARCALEVAGARAKERSVFGERAIGSEQAIAHPLARLRARAEAASLLVHRTAARFDSGADPFAVAGEANMAKVLAADLVYDAADHAMQVFGGAAYDERAGLVDLFLDARLIRSAPISQELALNFIAEHVLGLPKR